MYSLSTHGGPRSLGQYFLEFWVVFGPFLDAFSKADEPGFPIFKNPRFHRRFFFRSPHVPGHAEGHGRRPGARGPTGSWTTRPDNAAAAKDQSTHVGVGDAHSAARMYE